MKEADLLFWTRGSVWLSPFFLTIVLLLIKLNFVPNMPWYCVLMPFLTVLMQYFIVLVATLSYMRSALKSLRNGSNKKQRKV